jgi:branched-subunit amino acid aminotransferase/4-amino-4-deoxychorismate lyase
MLYTTARQTAAAASDVTSKEFILKLPRGAYTTARTVGRSSVFELETHLERLATSAQLMMDDDAAKAAPTAGAAPAPPMTVDAVLLRQDVLASVRAAIASHAERSACELKVTVLATWTVAAGAAGAAGAAAERETSSAKFEVHTHVGDLVPRRAPPVCVVVRGSPRENARAKDSDWIRQRQGLEDEKPAHVDEVVMMAEDGGLPEGTQTNFFAVKGGTLFTAGEGVLEGTVRRVVLEVCERDGIPVELVPPNVADVMAWEGAFVSSTSRLVLPIDEIEVPRGQFAGMPEGAKRKFEGRSLVHQIEDKVMAEIESHSLSVM